MFSHTRRVGGAGRYGTRIGKKVRDELLKIEQESKKDRACPACGKAGVKRVSSGVWKCAPCKNVFTGGAHIMKVTKKAEAKEASE